jgi:hypothetical protein
MAFSHSLSGCLRLSGVPVGYNFPSYMHSLSGCLRLSGVPAEFDFLDR